jgi:hypothetical protein
MWAREDRLEVVLSKFSSGLDQFTQECFSRHEAMGAHPELVKITSPLQAPSVVPACSSKEDKR